jgi:hypothetical protein
MFIVCVPIILLTYWARPDSWTVGVVQFQVAVLIVGTIAGAVVWYFFAEKIVEGATRIYETLLGRDREERVGVHTRPYEPYDARGPHGQKETKYCISCRAEIPRRARFCRDCGEEQ